MFYKEQTHRSLHAEFCPAKHTISNQFIIIIRHFNSQSWPIAQASQSVQSVQLINTVTTWFYSATRRIVNTWNISGIFIVLWPITAKLRARDLAKKNHKLINVLACGLVFSHLIGFSLARQKHSRNISGVHGFPGLTVIRTKVTISEAFISTYKGKT